MGEAEAVGAQARTESSDDTVRDLKAQIASLQSAAPAATTVAAVAEESQTSESEDDEAPAVAGLGGDLETLWLTETDGATLTLTTPFGTVTLPTADIGIEDTRLDYGGLERAVRLFRLPEDNGVQTFEHTLTVPIAEAGDTPIWLIVTTEDGHQAFTSPTYVFRSHND